MDILGKLGDPTADAAAIKPVLDEEEAKALDAVVQRIVPALRTALSGALTDALHGLTITISITKRST